MSLESVAALVAALQKSKILDAPQLQELMVKLKPRFSDPWALAEQMVRAGWLTPYQIKKISEGKADELVLKPYIILDRLGEGGVSQVYKARHSTRPGIVALKVIHAEMLHNEEAVSRFQREMQIASQLDHPNVVRAIDVGLDKNVQFFAMEVLEGIDLNKVVLESGPLPIELACEYTREAALALQHIHEHNLIHRDVKPANLFLTVGGVIKLLDLGLARLRIAAMQNSGGDNITREGIMLGTPDYLAPEQAKNPRGVDIRADIYSLGCTFYFFLTGKTPFQGKTLAEKLIKHQAAEAPRGDVLRPGLPPALNAMILKMMKKNPEDRYQTPAEVAEELAPYCDLSGGTGR